MTTQRPRAALSAMTTAQSTISMTAHIFQVRYTDNSRLSEKADAEMHLLFLFAAMTFSVLPEL